MNETLCEECKQKEALEQAATISKPKCARCGAQLKPSLWGGVEVIE